MVVEKVEAQNEFTRNIVIWSWWFAVVLTLAADTAAFYFVQDGLIDTQLATMIGQFLDYFGFYDSHKRFNAR